MNTSIDMKVAIELSHKAFLATEKAKVYSGWHSIEEVIVYWDDAIKANITAQNAWMRVQKG